MTIPGIGNFHKTLPHNEFGEVSQTDFAIFRQIIAHGQSVEEFDKVPGPTIPADTKSDIQLVNPVAGRSASTLGPDPRAAGFPTPPDVASNATAVEMLELFWHAHLRDLPFNKWHGNEEVSEALKEIKQHSPKALHDGGLRLRLDLPQTEYHELDIRPETLFRLGLLSEDKGPLVSQFFLHDVGFGTQLIVQKQQPYRINADYLKSYDDWIRAQNLGVDYNGNGYPKANTGPEFLEGNGTIWRRIQNLRDLARFVHKDALHQAYFNAALLLIGWEARVDNGNPYRSVDFGGASRQRGFGSLGAPHLLTLVSEVASRALQVVWYQKWQKHLRLRPEAYGGLMQMQREGFNRQKRNYGLPEWLFETWATQSAHSKNKTWFLPMAFSSGSPLHPAYGAGHATVAGACVTILKAWFQEDQPFETLVNGKTHPLTGKPVRIVQPGDASIDVDDGTGGKELPDYFGHDKIKMTVGGELNKIAANVAMGRSYGGVHWRSDNSRSLRLGERIAVEILADMSAKVAERNELSLEFWSFDRQKVVIQGGQISVGGGASFPAKDTFANWPII
jgi:hypothetical protein